MARLRYLQHAEAINLVDPADDAVVGGAGFYASEDGWTKVWPGTLGLRELYGGGTGFGNQPGTSAPVEFYVAAGGLKNSTDQSENFIALDGSQADYFTITFFGRRR